jgi:citrate lyase synthetase
VAAASGFPPRRCFKQRDFAAKHGLVPVAAVTYLCEHDASQAYMAAKIQGIPPPDDE